MSTPVHLLKSVTAGIVLAKCGATGKRTEITTTNWHTEVTCPDCQEKPRAEEG